MKSNHPVTAFQFKILLETVTCAKVSDTCSKRCSTFSLLGGTPLCTESSRSSKYFYLAVSLTSPRNTGHILNINRSSVHDDNSIAIGTTGEKAENALIRLIFIAYDPFAGRVEAITSRSRSVSLSPPTMKRPSLCPQNVTTK